MDIFSKAFITTSDRLNLDAEIKLERKFVL
jgi:hypothetical protein